jgi:anthranilate synthase/aminodeoxychorismate synthase-like glutamine amidotransferase
VTRILVVDNYDSFVYNLVQYIGQLGAEPIVYRNDAISVGVAEAIGADGLMVSPGPGRPEDAGVSEELITNLGKHMPVFGVCLGHQCIGDAFGATVVRHAVMHGKTSEVTHDGEGVFAGLVNPITAIRYHSLVVEEASLPPVLEITARAEDGTIMGLRHRDLPIEGVQFHPESILTDEGHHLVANWLATCGHHGALEAVPAAAARLRAPGL